MATCGCPDNHIIYRAIERYELKQFLLEAVDKRVISEKEKREVEQWRPSGKQRMREHLIKLILAGGKERQFIEFIDYYASLVELAAAQLRKQRGGCNDDNSSVDSRSGGASHSHGQQLSQDSSNSDSSSPLEFETLVSDIPL